MSQRTGAANVENSSPKQPHCRTAVCARFSLRIKSFLHGRLCVVLHKSFELHNTTLVLESHEDNFTSGSKHMAEGRPDFGESGLYKSLRSSLIVAEVEDIATGEVLYVTFACFDSHGTAWFGQVSGVRKYDLRDEDYYRLLKPVLDEQVYPLAPLGLDLRDPGDTDGCYVKRANLIGFDDPDVAELLPEILLEEAKTLQFLKHYPHPNLVEYYGCILKGDRIAGLVLKKYSETLQQRVEQSYCGLSEFDAASCMKHLRSGVQHLHSLGLAHNDLNPKNIALDEDNGVVILDFGSCRKFGEELISAGTPGWFNEESPDWAVSAKSHDDFALQEIERWLNSKRLECQARKWNSGSSASPIRSRNSCSGR